MKQIKHIFFDLDHTLWDFERNAAECLHEIFEAHIFPDFVNFPDFLSVFSKINEKLWNQLDLGLITQEYLRETRFNKTFETMGHPIDTNLSTIMNDHFLQLLPLKKHLIEDAEYVLKRLKLASYHLHIISNGYFDVQTQKMRSSNILHYFDQIITFDVAGYRKPSLGIFEFALLKSNALHQEAIMIGDNLIADIEGAKNAGIQTIHFDITGNSTEKRTVTKLKNIIQILT